MHVAVAIFVGTSKLSIMRKSLALFFLTFSFSGMYAQNWDIHTLHKINHGQSRFARNYSETLSHSTFYLAVGVPVGMAAYAGVTRDQSLLSDAIYIGTSVAEAVVISCATKYMIDRERPYDSYPDRVIAYSHESTPSFPSAHTASAFALGTSLSLKYPRWYVIAPSAIWACSVGISRMQEGVHYPSDVIAGAVIGSGCAVVNLYVNRYLNKWLFPEKKQTKGYTRY